MAKAKRSKIGNTAAVQDSRSSDEEFDEDNRELSRSASYLRTAEDMLAASRKRRDAKRKAIETEHTQRIEKTRAKIESFYDERRRKLKKLQSEQWEELSALLKTRMSIEKSILKNVAVIEQMTLNMASELDSMYAGRLNDIVEMGTTGKTQERA